MTRLGGWVGNRESGWWVRLAACIAFAVVSMAVWPQASAGEAPVPLEREDVAATVLLVVGVILLVLEIKIVSMGFLGVLGTLCLIFGVGVMWQNDRALWGVSAYYIIPLLLMIFILTVTMVVLTARVYREGVVSGREGYVGGLGEVSEALTPKGRVFFEGTYWTAESREHVAKGEKVRIIGVDGLKLYVEPAGESGFPGVTGPVADSDTGGGNSAAV